MSIFHASKKFPAEERYSLTDQIRRSSRSVATNIAEAWRKRRYRAAFASKLNDAEAEAAETQILAGICGQVRLPAVGWRARAVQGLRVNFENARPYDHSP